jgi:hypothetical protein
MCYQQAGRQADISHHQLPQHLPATLGVYTVVAPSTYWQAGMWHEPTYLPTYLAYLAYLPAGGDILEAGWECVPHAKSNL